MNLPNPTQAAYELNGRPVGRTEFYAIACNPGRSVAVEACAGAGKTWMLVSRIVRALLAGAPPQDILAITFTRKAAGEMRHRLDEWLIQFARQSPTQLQQELLLRGLPAPEAERLAPQLQGLYAQVLGAGRPVQIRTFHSWFAALLRTAPLSVLQALGLPTHYSLLEDDHEAVRLVWRRLHAAAVREPSLRADFTALVAAHGRHAARRALQAALNRRVEFTLADAAGVVEASVPPFHQLPGAPAAWAGLARPELALDGDGARQRWLAWAQALGREANKTPQKAASAIEQAWSDADPAERLGQLRAALFVKTADRLSSHLQKFPAAQEAEAELQPLCAAVRQHEAWLHQQRMARLTRCLIAEYAQLKRENGWVDMNDVERAAQVLLSSGALSGWVQEKLDARVRHLLIDEFQDTNPLQWQALHAWLSGYVGSGGGQTPPSVFIVGDPKQSIYRFRRAEPQVFRAAQVFVREGLGGDLLSCDHTRRNAPGVIEVVNAVMQQAQGQGAYQGFRAHTTESQTPGRVLSLPPVSAAPQAEAEDAAAGWIWRDSLTTPRIPPEETLRTLECRQAAAWLAGQIAVGVPPRQIMVLSRRRERLGVMEDELRRLHIATQQPEKNDLAQAAEVQDLIALFDVLVSPAHDLALARALKSPLFGADDPDLVALAQCRRACDTPRTWLELLLGEPLAGAEPDPLAAQTLAEAAARLPGRLQQAAVALRRYRDWVHHLPPHDALAAIYHDADVLARYAALAPAALRGTVLANLRALLSASLELEGGRYLTPYALVRAFRAGGIAAPMTADADAVRLLTIHGAKGLEADLVLLLDSDAAPPKADTMGLLVDWPGESLHPVKLVFLVSEAHPPPCATEALAREQTERGREELNALYVAMTRARQTLALSCVPPRTPNPGSAWQRITPWAQPVGEGVPEAGAPEAAPDADGAAAWAELRELPALDAVSPVPAADAAAAEPGPEGEDVEEGAAPDPGESDGDRLDSRIGQAMHWLLETWVTGARDFAPQRLQQAAQMFTLEADALAQACTRARAILDGQGAWAWDAGQIDWHGNEVELGHKGRRLRMDRLVHRSAPPALAGWWVLDYKSAVRPETQPALIAQLRRYRAALQLAYPREPVYAAFLTGDGGQIQVDAGLAPPPDPN